MSTWYPDVITAQHRLILEKTAVVPELVLVGGTALALQIGHRLSYDLDFTVAGPVTDQLISTVLSVIKPQSIQQRLFNELQYTAFVDDIKITIFQDQAKCLHPAVYFAASPLAAVADIFSTKLFIIGKRNAWRDYVDIAYCLHQKLVSLDSGIAEAVKRYQVAQKWILEPLVYFQDIQMTPIEWLAEPVSDEELKRVLTDSVRAYVAQH